MIKLSTFSSLLLLLGASLERGYSFAPQKYYTTTPTLKTTSIQKTSLLGYNKHNEVVAGRQGNLYQKKSHIILDATADSDGSKNTPDIGDLAKYVFATAVQYGILGGVLKGLDKYVLPALPASIPKRPLIVVLFMFLSLRSRVASVLDNSRPNRELQDGKATPSDVKRPSWTPPGIAFPFIWLTITALRGISSGIIYKQTQTLYCPELLAMILHLSIGDTWNTITNIEKRLGVSAVGVLFVWASVWNAIIKYYNILPIAGKLLAPSGVWISIASVLTITIWRINKPVQPLWPVKNDGKSSSFKFANLGQLQPTSIGGRQEPPKKKRINTKIDLSSPKVATMETLKPSDKKVYCRCWKSETFPLCDGSHMAHNKKTGDNVGPVIITAKKKKE